VVGEAQGGTTREEVSAGPGTKGTNPQDRGIPTIRDRVVQAAAKVVLEPIFEAEFEDCAYGYRPRRSA
jgi:retron-type reverse transcriptase